MLFTQQDIPAICELIAQGQLLAYPTEAVWGIGCDPFNEAAVHEILGIKQRPIEKGMIVVTASPQLIQPFLAPLASEIQQAILTSWQQTTTTDQAHTWLLPIPTNLPQSIPDWVTGGRDTLAVRVINHPDIAAVCQALADTQPNNPYGFLISTSCNPSGGTPATNLAQAQAYFGDRIGYLVGDTLGYTQPSQIHDALSGNLVRN
jgi:L-threonylcarbamoyladenylate synthase